MRFPSPWLPSCPAQQLPDPYQVSRHQVCNQLLNTAAKTFQKPEKSLPYIGKPDGIFCDGVLDEASSELPEKS